VILTAALVATNVDSDFSLGKLINPLRVLEYAEGHRSNNVDPLVSGFSQIYLTVKYI
jgi:hypothetical protein